MKNALLYFLILFFTLPAAFAQDLILTKTGNELSGKVVEVLQTEIRLSQADSVLSIPKADIFMITYANGSKALYGAKKAVEEDPEVTAILAAKLSTDSLKVLGEQDARKHYKGYKGAATGTFLSSLVLPPAGLIFAVSTSCTRPTSDNLNYPSEKLFRQPGYKNGYRESAHRKKQQQVWTNFFVGAGLSVALSVFILPTVIKHF